MQGYRKDSGKQCHQVRHFALCVETQGLNILGTCHSIVSLSLQQNLFIYKTTYKLPIMSTSHNILNHTRKIVPQVSLIFNDKVL